MARVRSFEVQDIKCIDDGTGDQGLIFIGPNEMVTLVLDRGCKGYHDEEVCSLQYKLWNGRPKPITMYIQEN